jgi:hypothetical protein
MTSKTGHPASSRADRPLHDSGDAQCPDLPAPTPRAGSGVRWSLEPFITSYHYRGLSNCTYQHVAPQRTLLQF